MLDEGERKHVTVLFADVKSSMELLAERDPEDARRLLDPVLQPHDGGGPSSTTGSVNQVMGDGIMALFGAPLAHEDHAVRACYAALRMQESDAARTRSSCRQALGAVVSIRVGLNSGEVVVALDRERSAHGLHGRGPDDAPRPRAWSRRAAPGSILISADTAALVGGYVVLEPLGPIRIKGSRPAWRSSRSPGRARPGPGCRSRRPRGLTPFVGRASEVRRMLHALGPRSAPRAGGSSAVVGEPGVGKSRLLLEFIHSEHTEGCLLLEGQAASYTKQASYAPIIDLLKKLLRDRGAAGSEAIRVRSRAECRARDPAPLAAVRPGVPRLARRARARSEWTALDPSLRRARAIEGIRRLLRPESQRQPVVLALEGSALDADSETHAVLDALVETLAQPRASCSRQLPARRVRACLGHAQLLHAAPARSADARERRRRS